MDRVKQSNLIIVVSIMFADYRQIEPPYLLLMTTTRPLWVTKRILSREHYRARRISLGLSPNSVASPPSEYYGQNEENLEPRILSPYSGAGDSEEGAATVYAASPETFSGALYYKQEITESGEFMDVVSWWEQEQGRLVHQQHAQRLTHV